MSFVATQLKMLLASTIVYKEKLYFWSFLNKKKAIKKNKIVNHFKIEDKIESANKNISKVSFLF